MVLLISIKEIRLATSANQTMTFNTPLGDDSLLFLKMQMYDELGKLFEIKVDCASNVDQVDFDQILGKNSYVSVIVNSGQERDYCGMVTEIEYLGRDMDTDLTFSHYSLTLRPWL